MHLQAFEALLASVDEDDVPRQRQRGGRQGRRGRGEERVPGFRLRDEASTLRAPLGRQGQKGADGMGQLLELLGSTIPADLIGDVYFACGGNLEAAMAALLGMAGDGSGTGSAAPGAASEASAAAGAGAEQGRAAAPAPVGPCYWDLLPRECRDQVFARLSVRELAQAARSCREWAAYVREQRSGLRSVRVPPDISHSALRALVAAFRNATEVDLRWVFKRDGYRPDMQRLSWGVVHAHVFSHPTNCLFTPCCCVLRTCSAWRDALRQPYAFEAAATAIALGEGDRCAPVSPQGSVRAPAVLGV